MGAAAGWWQTGPGGIVGNLVASGLYSLGSAAFQKLFDDPTLGKTAELLLDHEGLNVPNGKVASWFVQPATFVLIAAVSPRDWGGRPPSDADDVALDNAAYQPFS